MPYRAPRSKAAAPQPLPSAYTLMTPSGRRRRLLAMLTFIALAAIGVVGLKLGRNPQFWLAFSVLVWLIGLSMNLWLDRASGLSAEVVRMLEADTRRSVHPSNGPLGFFVHDRGLCLALCMVAFVAIAAARGLGSGSELDYYNQGLTILVGAAGLHCAAVLAGYYLASRYQDVKEQAKTARRAFIAASVFSFLAFAAAWLAILTGKPRSGVQLSLLAALTLVPCIHFGMLFRQLSGFDSWQKRLEQESLRADLAEHARQIAEMQLAVLQAQIEPHFLYNTLASIQYLVERDAPTASLMLGHLIAYLQEAMPQMRDQRSTLGRELGLSTSYLEIARIRMGGRLSLNTEVPAELKALSFPPMVLQTLVENALKHGVEPKVGPCTVAIGAEQRGDQLVVWVQDDGIGLSQGRAPTAGSGTGIRNIEQRLATLYGEDGTCRVGALPNGGVRAEVRLPAQRLTASDDAIPTANAP